MRTVLQVGSPIETLTQGELHDELARTSQEWFRQYGKSVKYMRFGPVPVDVVDAAFSLDGSASTDLGPREGFAWSVRRITVWGLAGGTTPDIANLYRNQPGGIPVWQFNGNNFAYTFGKLEMLLLPGETMALASQGDIAATGTITISGDILEIAAEEISKIA